MELIKKHLDKIFDLFLQAGIKNRFDVAFQITCLIYLKSLEDIEQVRGNGYIYPDSVFDGHEQYKWSSLVRMEPEEGHAFYTSKILPFLDQLFLEIKIDTLSFSYPSIVSNQIFYLLLTSIDQMFYEVLKGEPMGKEKIRVYGEIYDCMINYLVESSAKTRMLFAPKYLRKLVCALAQLTGTDMIFDPAMGVGNLLMEANRDMLVKASPKYKQTEDEDGFPVLRNFAEAAISEKCNVGATLEGEEEDPILRFLCQMNFYFHFANVNQLQFYENPEDELLRTRYFHKILSVLPIDKHTFGIVDTAIERLCPEGVAVMVVPMSFLYNSNSRQQAIRKKILIEYKVEAVIALPEHEFEPQAAIYTAILVIRNMQSSMLDKIWFCDLKNDGYSNDKKRMKNADKPLPILVDSFLRRNENHNDWFDSKCVAVSEVLDNDASLLVAQYVDADDEPVEEMDLDVIIDHLDYFQGKIRDGIEELRRYL